MNLVTVITPTFNRAVTLSRCWQSLKKQSNKNFQWLIIDDGSTDETLDLVNGLKKETKDFQIDYYWKINGGKHTALNFSHQYIKGDFVLILDSDDCLTVDAIDTILNEWKQNRNNSNIAGVTFMSGMKKDVPLAKMSQNRVLSNHIDFRINKKIVGDCCETLRTNVFKSYLFPEIKGEFFLGEGMLWTSVALKYETLYINKVIYIVPEYRPDGLTQAGRKMRLKNLQGALLNC